MNTLLVHQAFASPKQPGGTRHYELARHLVKKGHKFTIIAGSCNHLTGKKAFNINGLVERQNMEGISILCAYTYPSLHRSYTWRIISFLSFMISSIIITIKEKDIDLIMGTTPSLFQAGSAWFAATLLRRPFLLEIRDLWPDFAIDLGILNNKILIKLARRVEKFLYHQATHLLVNSPAYRDYLINKRVPEDKITLIPNGVDVNMFDPKATGELFRQRFGLEGKFLVTYTGALGLANDIDTILHAAVRLKHEKNIYFLLVGDGKERIRLEAKARDLNLSQVMFTGPYPKAKINEVLAASNVCVATLKNILMFRTTYPNKVFDYMAAGRPIALCIDGVIRKVVEKAKAGVFIPPGDDRALALKLQDLYHNSVKAKSMGVAGRSYVIKHFNRTKQSEDFTGLISKMVAK